jgi:hypothetical protein
VQKSTSGVGLGRQPPDEDLVIIHPAVEVLAIEVDGKWFVDTTMNGRLTKRRGPFSADKAKAVADLIIKEFTPTVPTTTNNDSVVLNGKPIALDSHEGHRFVIDCTRAGEKLVSDSELQQIYEISPENWAELEKNANLIKAIRDERKRRIRSGQAARESACEIYAKTPAVVGKILEDEKMPARHRIEAAKEIRQQAIGGDGVESTADATEKFVITINLGPSVDEQIKIEVPPEDIRRNTAKQIEGEIDAEQ